MSATLFIGADTDGDGTLTIDEVSAIFEKVLGKEQLEKMGDVVKDIFAKMDHDNSGTVTIAEVKAYAKDLSAGMKI